MKTKKLKIILTILALSYLPIATANNTVASASRNSFYVINSEGKSWAWGKQVGDGNYGKRNTATPLSISHDFHIVKIAASSSNGAALTNDGKVLVWGTGSLGDGVERSASASPLLTPLSGIIDVVATNTFNLVVKENGEVWGWGYSLNGIMGTNHDERDERTYVPVQIQGLSNIIKISSQGRHVLALDNHGNVWSWGANGAGQLGNGSRSGDKTIVIGFSNTGTEIYSSNHYHPTKIQGLPNITAIETGSSYSMALSTDGNVFSWGDGSSGVLGQTSASGQYITAPGQIGLLKNIKTISAGYGHALAISHDGEVWAWGSNFYGEIGDGTTDGDGGKTNGGDYIRYKRTPIKLAISDVVAGAASERTTAVIKADGSVWTWGGNHNSLMGINVPSPDDEWSSANSIYLDAQQVIDSSLEFLNIGESNLSNKVIVDTDLNIQIPSAIYQSSGGETNIWVNLDFKGIDSDGDYIWKLKGYGNN